MDYKERLRRLAINEAEDALDLGDLPCDLDPRTRALVELAALIAVGGAVPSYGAQADAAVDAGATAADLVDVLVAVVPLVGVPRAVAAAPRLAMALGYDTEETFQDVGGG